MNKRRNTRTNKTKCCVKHCPNILSAESGVGFFRFPTAKDR